jgi:hypothetical protein
MSRIVESRRGGGEENARGEKGESTRAERREKEE